MNENNIQKLALRMKLITVEDMCQYTIAQLVYMLANKVNEMITNVSEFEDDIDATVKTQNENIQHLLGEGLHSEVATIFEKWVKDGTFDELINQSALEKVNNRMNGLINNILSEGAKSGDEGYDNAVIINRMINRMPNGGVIQIPVGKFYIKSPIILKPHITLQGVGSTTPDDSSNGSMLCLSSEVSDIDMVIASGTEEGYCYGVSIKNIGIEGHGKALTGIKLSDCSRTLIEKVDIHYCNIGLEVTGGMLDTYKDMNLLYNRAFNLLIKNTRLSTTQRFYNCYFGQQKPYPNAIPIKIESTALTDCTFYSCTVETTPNAVIINRNNNVAFDNIYTENAPCSGKGSVFKIGYKEEDEQDVAHDGTFKIKGGMMCGAVDSYELKSMFDIDYCDGFSVEEVMYRRFGKVITTTSHTRCIPSFRNCLGENGLVTTDLDQSPDDIGAVNCIVRDHQLVNKEGRKNLYELGFFSLLNGWGNFYEGYETMKAYKTSTGVALQGVIKGGTDKVVMTLPEGLRPKENIILNGNYVHSESGSWTLFAIIIKSNGEVEFHSPATMRNQAHAFCLNFQAK